MQALLIYKLRITTEKTEGFNYFCVCHLIKWKFFPIFWKKLRSVLIWPKLLERFLSTLKILKTVTLFDLFLKIWLCTLRIFTDHQTPSRLIGKLSTRRFWDGNRKWAVFPFNLSSHNQIYIQFIFSTFPPFEMISLKTWGAALLPWHSKCLRLSSASNNRELKHARFWDADGNRKRTFRVPGQWCLTDFYANHL